MSDHCKVERQIAAMHLKIAERLRDGDSFPILRARSNLQRWRERFGGSLPPAYDEWAVLMDEGTERVIRVLEGDDPESIRRRASSPFSGVLSPQERWRIIQDAA